MACNCYSISASQDPISPSLGVTFFYTTCDLVFSSTTLDPFQSAYICSNGFPSAFPSDRGTIFGVDESFCGGCVTCSPTTPATGTEISMGCVYGAFGLAPFPGANIGLNSTLGVNRQPPQALGVTAIASLAETVLSADMGGLDTLNNYCCTPSSWFVSTWNTANTIVGGGSNSNQVRLPLKSSGTYNFIVEWGDGSSDTITAWNQAATTHTYPSSGTYTINIIGVCQGFAFQGSNTSDRAKILSITSFGNVILGDYPGVFEGCINLDLPSVLDTPDLSSMSSLSNMFKDCDNLSTINNINLWGVGTITNMSGMFNDALLFNQNLNNWNVGNVTNMAEMFRFAYNFNGDITNWNVSNVTNMSEMFYAATFFGGTSSFNQPLNNWDVSSVTNMYAVFGGTTSFNQPLNNWDVSNVTNMAFMFAGSAFNQSIGNWDVSNVTDMNNMFWQNSTFNQSLNSWDVSSVTDMFAMFFGASAFNQPLNSWNVSNVTRMTEMFRSATVFNQDIGGWNVSNVTDFLDFMRFKTNANYSATNLNSIYNNWSLLTLNPNLNINFGTIKYTLAGQAGRNILTGAPNNWTITDGGT